MTETLWLLYQFKWILKSELDTSLTMQCVGSIVHLRNVNRSQNTKPEVTFMSWQEMSRRVMRPWSLNCIFFFQEDEECCVWQDDLQRRLPTSIILWIHDSVTPDGGSDLYFSLCVTLIQTKIWNASLYPWCWPGEISHSCCSGQGPQKSKSEFVLGMWDTCNGTITPTSESPPPIRKDQFEFGKTTHNGHDYNKCPPFPSP